MEEIPDFDLMERIGNGDQDAFLALVRRHQGPLVNFFRRLGAYTDAEDLVQETFLRVFKYRFKYRPSAKFTTFLYTLARHTRADGLRKARTQETVSERLGAETDGGVAVVSHEAQTKMDAETALGGLPEKLRLVVVMSLYQGLRYEEIAEILEVPVGTVKSRMFLAVRRLREVFDVGSK